MDGLKEGSRLAVGSLPALDPTAAVQTQLAAFPEIPAWPQLPRKSPLEKMNLQGLSGLPGLVRPSPDNPVWKGFETEGADWLETLKSENQNNRLERAAFKPDEAAGFYSFLKEAGKPGLQGVQAVKGQMAGPITLGLTLKDEKGKSVLGSAMAMEILREYLLLHARWQVQQLAAFRKPVVFFLDEPVLGVSFKPQDYGLTWDLLGLWLSKFFSPLQEEGVVTGFHCCGPGPWDWLFEMPVEMIHLDAFQFMPQVLKHAAGVKNFIHRGGILVWGMVPTAMDKGLFPEPAEILQQWMDAVDSLAQQGVSREELAGRSFFSTSCGLGGSQVSVAEEAVRCLGSFVSLWKAMAF